MLGKILDNGKMVRRFAALLWLILAGAAAQAPTPFVCPMDPGVQAPSPGRCPVCGMKLVPKLADALEYPVDLTISPRAFHAGQEIHLTFAPRDPHTGKPVTQFEVVHEKLFHLFIVSRDLQYFAHEHPDYDGAFHFTGLLPQTGQYRLLCDFYPAGGTPQLVAKTLIAPGASIRPAAAGPPPQAAGQYRSIAFHRAGAPIAGQKTLLFFHLNPAGELEPFLGAWGHLLAASEDLVDMIHAHPAFSEAGPVIQFNLIFPRPGVHRLWVQFQRAGKLNTAVFDVPVSGL
jgi:hypothetical protein